MCLCKTGRTPFGNRASLGELGGGGGGVAPTDGYATVK